MTEAQPEIYDVIGIGFGPANMSLAIVLEEEAEREGGADFSRLFLEAKSDHAWHPGMLLEESLLQITVLKDLITVHNPCSRFSFLCYLKEKDRLFEFLNLRDLFPSRIEFNDYLGWAADKLSHRVRYGQRVVRVEPVESATRRGKIDHVKILTEDETGKRTAYLARNVVLATGGQPTAPQGVDVQWGGRVIHPHVFCSKIHQDFPDPDGAYSFIVVGSGQSGAELFDYLMRHYPNADVTAAIRRYAYKPVDESDFTNRIFFPEWTDYYYSLKPERRRDFFKVIKDVNYAVVDHPLIKKIYRNLYDEKVRGKKRARVRPFLELRAVTQTEDAVEATFFHKMEECTVDLTADALILSTGYHWKKEHPALDPLADHFARDDLGGYLVQRDYKIAPRDGLEVGVYLQGYCEDTHGISETVLSLLPIRANDILQSLRSSRRRRAAAGAEAEQPVRVGG